MQQIDPAVSWNSIKSPSDHSEDKSCLVSDVHLSVRVKQIKFHFRWWISHVFGRNFSLWLIMLWLAASHNSFYTTQIPAHHRTLTWPRNWHRYRIFKTCCYFLMLLLGFQQMLPTVVQKQPFSTCSISLCCPSSPSVVNEWLFCLCLDELIREGCATAPRRLSSCLDRDLHEAPWCFWTKQFGYASMQQNSGGRKKH